MCGQTAENVANASIVVISTAIKQDNPNWSPHANAFADCPSRRNAGRADAAALVSRRCRHAWQDHHHLADRNSDPARIDPTVINGGIITGWGSNARLGKGQWMVVEAMKATGPSKLNPTVAVVTNIDPEHLDHHSTFEALEQAFFNLLLLCLSMALPPCASIIRYVQRLMAGIKDRRIITYGLSANADVRAVNLRHDGPAMLFDVLLSDRTAGAQSQMNSLRFPMPVEHNVQNCLAAIAVALEMGMTLDEIATALASFGGVGRRFETGRQQARTVIDDYGHHPVEIRAALQAGRMLCGTNKLVAVAVAAPLQPPRRSV